MSELFDRILTAAFIIVLIVSFVPIVYFIQQWIKPPVHIIDEGSYDGFTIGESRASASKRIHIPDLEAFRTAAVWRVDSKDDSVCWIASCPKIELSLADDVVTEIRVICGPCK